jgi:hypothetical protein
MSARGRGTLRSAMLGFAVTAVFVAYQLVTDPQSPFARNSALMLAFVILCPPSLLSLPFIDAEAGTNGFFFLWTFIGVLNAALYASIRALISRTFKKAD